MTSENEFAPYDVGRAWFITWTLCLLYVLSFVDRLIPSLLVQPITQQLNISDGQMGVMFGAGFGILYAIISIPVAHFLDNYNRIRILTVGILLWSICTIASGFANDYSQLVVLRSGVAIGEAVLSPAAISLIGDMFVREKRTRPTGLFMATASISSATFIVAGAAYRLAQFIAPSVSMQPWRLTFVVVGLPGVLFSILLLFIAKEPRRLQNRGGPDRYASVAQVFAYVNGEKRLFGCLCLACCVFTAPAYAVLSWMPTFLIRGFGMTPAEAGYAYGTTSLIGVVGAVLWPTLAGYFLRRNSPAMIAVTLATAIPVGLVGMGMIGLAPTVRGVLLAVSVFVLGGSCCYVLCAVIIQTMTPSNVRGRLMAMTSGTGNLVGLVVGPSLAAWLANHHFSGPRAYGMAFSVMGFTAAPIVLGLVIAAKGRFDHIYRAETENERLALQSLTSEREQQPAGGD